MTTNFILREGRAVALLQNLAEKPAWLTVFEQLDVAHFQSALADLRNAPQHSLAWQVRHDLAAYLVQAEQVWQPPSKSNVISAQVKWLLQR